MLPLCISSASRLYSVIELDAVDRRGQLAGLAHGHEARVEARGERAAEDEAARLDADDGVDVLADEALGDPVEHDVQRARAGEERRDVLEDDPGPGEVGHVADERAAVARSSTPAA